MLQEKALIASKGHDVAGRSSIMVHEDIESFQDRSLFDKVSVHRGRIQIVRELGNSDRTIWCYVCLIILPLGGMLISHPVASSLSCRREGRVDL